MPHQPLSQLLDVLDDVHFIIVVRDQPAGVPLVNLVVASTRPPYVPQSAEPPLAKARPPKPGCAAEIREKIPVSREAI